jgi:hypothetical protein
MGASAPSEHYYEAESRLHAEVLTTIYAFCPCASAIIREKMM